MAYPTLSTNPSFPLDEGRIVSSIKSNFEAGYVLARARHTRQRKTFKVNYILMSDEDKVLLEAHIDSVLDITPFTWVHPKTSVSYTVRYQSVPQFQYVQYPYWAVNFILEQI